MVVHAVVAAAAAEAASDVDPEAERARRELRVALQGAFPKNATPSRTSNDSVGGKRTRGPASVTLGSTAHDGADDAQEGLDQPGLLSVHPPAAQAAWTIEKAHELHRDGNSLFKKGHWLAAAAKYRSALDLIGERERFPEKVWQTHDDLLVLCSSNLAACALKQGDVWLALSLCQHVLSIDPHHSKARFRRAVALVRITAMASPVQIVTDDPGPSWPGGGIGIKAHLTDLSAQRAAELLEAQQELERACMESPRDPAVRAAVEELFVAAKTETVRLWPPPWLFPYALRNFEYCHAPCKRLTAPVASAFPSKDSDETSLGVPGRERNLLLLLHGFGGRKDSFVALTEQMQLPQTAVLALNSPFELPSELLDDPPGYSWFEVLDENLEFIEPSPQERRRTRSLQQSCDWLSSLLDALMQNCGWALHELFLLGYGQGGTVALELLLRHCTTGCSERGLGGVVGVATEVLPETMATITRQQRSPTRHSLDTAVLLIHGNEDARISAATARASADCLREALHDGDGCVELQVLSGRGGEMLRGGNAEECRCVMDFFANHLHGVGRRGSEETMMKLGAEPVAEVFQVEAEEFLQEENQLTEACLADCEAVPAITTSKALGNLSELD